MNPVRKGIERISRGFNAVAGAAVVVMMLLTCADVVLRFFRHPVPGTYELVGFLGTMVISFSMAYTSLERGHIAVEIVVEKLPRRVRTAVEAAVALIGAALFALIAWQSAAYAADLRHSGEVSVTLAMPIYPFIYGMAAGSALLTLVLLSEALRDAARVVKA